jgi:hypothetical protein
MGFKVCVRTRISRDFDRVPHLRTSVRGPIMNFSNALTVRIKALDGLRPSFSSHVRWCEHGAPIEIAVVSGSHAACKARTLHKSRQDQAGLFPFISSGGGGRKTERSLRRARRPLTRAGQGLFLSHPEKRCCDECECFRSSVLEPSSVWLYAHLSLPVSSTHHGVGLVPRVLEMACSYDRRGKIQSGRPILGQDFWAQFCHRCRHRHSYGISVRNELGRLFALRRRHHRADTGNGRDVCLLSGKRVRRRPHLGRKEIGSPLSPPGNGRGCAGKLAVRLLHSGHECLHAASGGLSSRCARISRHREFSCLPAESVGLDRVLAQSNSSSRNRLVRSYRHWGVLSVAPTASDAGSTLSERGNVHRAYRVSSGCLSNGRSAGQDGRKTPTGHACCHGRSDTGEVD